MTRKHASNPGMLTNARSEELTSSFNNERAFSISGFVLFFIIISNSGSRSWGIAETGTSARADGRYRSCGTSCGVKSGNILWISASSSRRRSLTLFGCSWVSIKAYFRLLPNPSLPDSLCLVNIQTARRPSSSVSH